ncbi:MAG: protein phosphatase 2C domain-containing protein [Pirellulaceae bacterium]|nr:protein phosphatase 2C domain-containing protein [Pirellulaceae bacterium]
MDQREFNWNDDLRCVAATDIGMRRTNNQDSYAVVLAEALEAWQQRGHLLMVADGMGAHAAGELASKLAVDGVAHRYHKFADQSPPEALRKAVLETNAEIHRRGQANSDFRNMGTTGSALVLLPQGALVAQVGDSRIYRVRGNRIEQLTRDHSLVWELRELGQISEDGDVANSVPKNVITRSLGPSQHVDTDLEGPFPIELGDTYLICSDGLTGKIEDDELAAILSNLPPDEAAPLLVNLANLRGGPDNITLIIAKVVGPTLVTDHVESAPITLGASGATKDRSLIIWVAVAVCGLAAPVLLLTNNAVSGLVAIVAAGVFALIAWLAPNLAKNRGVAIKTGQQFGRGPYTNTECPPGDQVGQLLARISRDLPKSVEQQGYEIDLTEFESHCESAEKAQTAGTLQDAMIRRARGIRVLMRAVREEQNKNASDSAIEL